MKPDFYYHHDAFETMEANEKDWQAAIKRMGADGAKTVRVTVVDADHRPSSEDVCGFWVEGWKDVVDTRSIPFEPPLTYADA